MFSTHKIIRKFSTVTLRRDSNQANELAKYAIDFIKNGKPSDKIVTQANLIHADSITAGIAALALKTNIPSILKNEAYQFSKRGGTPLSRPKPGYAKVLGVSDQVPLERAIAANVSAVSELNTTAAFYGHSSQDSNGIRRAEIGQCDFLPIVITAAHQNSGMTGEKVVRAMILLDEIQARLCEVIPLSSYNIDYTFNGAVASLVTYGAIMGATPSQIEHAIGLYCAHSLPTNIARFGQLSDSVGAYPALSAELAISAIKRTLEGFSGPSDVFRNFGSLLKSPTSSAEESSFDLVLGQGGSDFAIGSHLFKIGIYHQNAASAIEATLKLLKENQFIEHSEPDSIRSVTITVPKDFVSTIGQESEKPQTSRQSATNSLQYLVSLILKKAITNPQFVETSYSSMDEIWKSFMPVPQDFTAEMFKDSIMKKLQKKVKVKQGDQEMEKLYPDGIPTSVLIELKDGKKLDSGLVVYPAGHPKNTEANVRKLIDHKLSLFGKIGLNQYEYVKVMDRLENLNELTNSELQQIYNCTIKYADRPIEDFVK